MNLTERLLGNPGATVAVGFVALVLFAAWAFTLRRVRKGMQPMIAVLMLAGATAGTGAATVGILLSSDVLTFSPGLGALLMVLGATMMAAYLMLQFTLARTIRDTLRTAEHASQGGTAKVDPE
jgi:hypothetical protein